jgi:hypothetical protein
LLRLSTKPSETLLSSLTVGGEAVLLTRNHLGEALIGLELLPLEPEALVQSSKKRRPQSCDGNAELAEALSQQGGGVERAATAAQLSDDETLLRDNG